MATKTKREEMLIVGVWNETRQRDEFYAGENQPLTDIRDDAAIVNREKARELAQTLNGYIDDAFND